MKKLKKQCPNCKGRGHVPDGLGMTFAVMAPIIGWGMLIFGNRDPSSFTRQQCDQCDGTGRLS